MRTIRVALLLAVLLVAAGCAEERVSRSSPASSPQLTTLQQRDYQTTTFETNDATLVTKVLFDVLRDEGFAGITFSKDFGMITASKAMHFDKNSQAREFIQQLGMTVKSEKHMELDLSATVNEFGAGCRARIVFQLHLLRSSGKQKNVVLLENPQYYRSFFEKLQNGLFLENQKL